MASTSASQPAEPEDGSAAEADDPAITPQTIPSPLANEAVITVKVGGDREGTIDATPLEGVTLQLYAGNDNGPTTAVTDDWATCVSDADGDCSFVVPETQTSNRGNCTAAGAGENCDSRFWIVQSGVPGGFRLQEYYRTGQGGGTESEATRYTFRTGTRLRATNTYRSTSQFMVGSGNSNRTASGGVWTQPRINPDVIEQCGLDIALILDLSGSVDATELVDLKAASDTLTDSLVGTPSRMSLFSFSTVSPAIGATQNYPGLSSVSTQAGANAFKQRYRSWTSGGGTNWARGLAVPSQSAAEYDLAIMITDGKPDVLQQSG